MQHSQHGGPKRYIMELKMTFLQINMSAPLRIDLLESLEPSIQQPRH